MLTFLNMFLQPSMLVVPDVHDVYAPLQAGLIVSVIEVSGFGGLVVNFCSLLLNLTKLGKKYILLYNTNDIDVT